MGAGVFSFVDFHWRSIFFSFSVYFIWFCTQVSNFRQTRNLSLIFGANLIKPPEDDIQVASYLNLVLSFNLNRL